uniref:alkaline phosphatase n=1 Tax=Timema douglasi TaxID=61478 RepID=A0A7R8VCV2_TIMDO|nr:unnamed protein product [Timema douglasi]
MATGIVTNARLTHATPAALYAHAPNRYWEDDSKVPVESRRTCKDIARQLVEDSPGKDINVILGGGRRHWEREGRRLDGRNLVDDWLRDKRRRGLLAHYVETTEELSQLNTRHLDYLLVVKQAVPERKAVATPKLKVGGLGENSPPPQPLAVKKFHKHKCLYLTHFS